MALNTKVPFAVPDTRLKLLGVPPNQPLVAPVDPAPPPSALTTNVSFTASIAGEVAVTVMFTVAVSVWPSASVIW